MKPSNAETYDTEYYAWQKAGASDSAQAMLPVVLELVPPDSLFDVGCGTGAWLRVASDLGVGEIFGVDGGSGDLVIPADQFRRVDLEQTLDVGRRFDLAMCMEVAEHISPQRASSFVEDLTRAADVVLFGAAIPGQGDPTSGEHINERWQSYWAGLFQRAGYRTVDALRPRIWDDDRIAFWYRQNAFFAVGPEARVQLEGRETIQDVVHPQMWSHVNASLWSSEASPRELVRRLPRAVERAVRKRVGR